AEVPLEPPALARRRQARLRLPPPGDGDETHGGLRCHPWESIPNDARPRLLRLRPSRGWMRRRGNRSRALLAGWARLADQRPDRASRRRGAVPPRGVAAPLGRRGARRAAHG